MQRYFVKDKKDNSYILSKDDSHHIIDVMRMNIKERLYIMKNFLYVKLVH